MFELFLVPMNVLFNLKVYSMLCFTHIPLVDLFPIVLLGFVLLTKVEVKGMDLGICNGTIVGICKGPIAYM